MSSLPAIYEPFVPDERQNRRTSARSRLFTLVQAHGVDEPMWAWDIGLGGMQCRTRQPRWPGTYLDLSFELPGTREKLEVGSQILSLGLRFCMLSTKAQRVIYRFLDRRRTLWSDEPTVPTEPKVRLAQWVAQQRRPFEAMLLEAYASLRAKELRRLAFVRAVRKEDLPKLSSLVG
ncbi:hypothetical protein ACFL6C_12940 [Myxococcota bacterium]